MAARRKQGDDMTMGGPGPKHKAPTLEEVPIDRIKALIEEGHTEVYVLLRSWSSKGLGALPARVIPTVDLINDVFAEALREEFGGGKFLLMLRDVIERDKELCQRFYISIVGQPRIDTPRAVPTSAAHTEGLRFGNTLGVAPSPAVRPQDIAGYRSDEIAMQTVEELRLENRQLKKDAQARERAAQAQLDTLRTQISEINARAQQQAADMRMEAIRAETRAELAALRDRVSQPPAKPVFGIEHLAALASAIVPVITAFISTNKDRAQMMLEQQKHDRDQQFGMLQALMKKPEGDGGLKVFLELLPKLLEARDPSKTADVIASMAESQLSTLHMTAQIMREVMPEADTPVMAIVKQLTEGVMGFVETAQQAAAQQAHDQQQRQLGPQQPQQRTLPQQPVQQQQVEVVATASVPPAVSGEGRRGRQVRSGSPAKPLNGREIAQAIVADERWPADMKSTTWVRLLTTLHGQQKPEEIGDEIAHMIEGLHKTRQCPAFLLPMFEDDGPAPSTLLGQLFGQLPIGMPEYSGRLQVILRAIDATYGLDSEDEEDEGDDGEDANAQSDQDDQDQNEAMDSDAEDGEDPAAAAEITQ